MTGAAEEQVPIKLAVDNSQSLPFPPADSPDSDRPGAADLTDLLKDAQQLLLYAAEAGIAVEDTVVQTILASAKKAMFTDTEALAAIKAVTTLSAKLKPVSADTLKIPKRAADKTLRTYFRFALCLGIPLIAISVLSFVAASLSRSIGEEITTANQLAVTLNAKSAEQVAAPDADTTVISNLETLTALQLFAAAIRKVEGLSAELRPLVWGPDLQTAPLASIARASEPGRILELRVPATVGQIKEKTEQFQVVRAHASQLQAREGVINAALANCILPSLYAILGACAYLLKTFSEQIRAHSFRPSGDSDMARFIIAAIGGGVVGLFTNFNLSSGTSLSVLAIAFLIGYATEVFFSFLDGLQQAFTKTKPN